jgi:hypothetical protein
MPQFDSVTKHTGFGRSARRKTDCTVIIEGEIACRVKVLSGGLRQHLSVGSVLGSGDSVSNGCF